MYIKTRLFHHLKWLNKAVAKVQGEAFMNSASLMVEIRVGNRVYNLYPMFTATLEGKKVYTHQFTDDAISFVGWKPYYNRTTPEIGKKLAFKLFVQQHGLRTPAYSTENHAALKNAIVKKDISSFGDQIKGPFADTAKHRLDAENGEFFETFTPGNIIKVWYWNEKPIVMESQPMPLITGDGRSTVKELINAYHVSLKSEGKINWQLVEEVLAFQNIGLGDILSEKKQCLVDFRYISAFSVDGNVSSILLEEAADFHAPLFKLGDCIRDDLLKLEQQDTVYSVDAIQDKKGNFWFLEVNFNPAIHPCLYAEMVKSLTSGSIYKELRSPAPVPPPAAVKVV